MCTHVTQWHHVTGDSCVRILRCIVRYKAYFFMISATFRKERRLSVRKDSVNVY